MKLGKTELLKAYKDMLLIRRFEEKVGQLYGMGLIGGFCHLYIGQEAVAVGVRSVLEEEDSVITSYRDHGIMLAAGSELKGVMSELLGKKGGCSKGKGGSMHMFDLDRHYYGGHGIVGAQVPIGTGIAFANQYKGNNKLCITYFGDGAANQGQVFESFNMAKLWNLPVIYVIENNEYAMGTSTKRATYSQDFYRRGETFGIPGVQVNGMSFVETHEVMADVCARVRQGNGPMIVEAKTYRYRGHSMSDPAKYRTKEEVTGYKDNDPITSLKAYITEQSIATEEEIKQIDSEIKSLIKETVASSQNSVEPVADELYKDVYIEA